MFFNFFDPYFFGYSGITSSHSASNSGPSFVNGRVPGTIYRQSVIFFYKIPPNSMALAGHGACLPDAAEAAGSPTGAAIFFLDAVRRRFTQSRV